MLCRKPILERSSVPNRTFLETCDTEKGCVSETRSPSVVHLTGYRPNYGSYTISMLSTSIVPWASLWPSELPMTIPVTSVRPSKV
jgi:hypothetical protein